MFKRKRNTVQKKQPKWIIALNKKTRHWSMNQKILFLAGIYALVITSTILCFITASTTSAKLLKTFNSSTEKAHKKAPLQLPTPFDITIDSNLIAVFNKQYDSLLQSATGRQKIDSFNKARPGFIDSARNASSLFNHFFTP